MMDTASFVAWGDWGGPAGIAATVPFDGQPATVGNGVMVALEVKSPADVDAVHGIAMAHGATDEGRPARAAMTASTPPISVIPMATS